METAPPSYQTATLRDPWPVIVPSVYSSDLPSACLVSRAWHALFVARLWANPTASAGLDRNAQRRGLDKYIIDLPQARPSVRALTHAINVSHLYDNDDLHGPDPAWLESVLSYLDNLQSLAMHSAPRFDCSAFASLPLDFSFNLRLLDISNCQNATPSGLAALLRHAQALVYLDLSLSPSASGEPVIRSLAGMSVLRVLKLQKIGLRDANVKLLAHAIAKRVRSLDLRDNKITTSGIETLRRACAPVIESLPMRGVPAAEATVDLESSLWQVLTDGHAGDLLIERAVEVGITHLYISCDHLEDINFAALLRKWPLFVLDYSSGQDPTVGFSGSFDPGRSTEMEHTGSPEVPETPDASETKSLQMPRPMTYLRAPFVALFDPLTIPTSGTGSTVCKRRDNDYELGAHCIQNLERCVSASELPSVSPHRINQKHDFCFSFRPSLFPNLRELVITEVPARSSDDRTSDTLISLIKSCAALARQAHLKARGDWSRPPRQRGETAAAALSRAAKSNFALETIVLQLRDVDVPQSPSDAHPSSITSDEDSENMWTEAQNDFSFFEPGFSRPSVGPRRAVTLASGAADAVGSRRLRVDNIARLAAFRAEAKTEFDRLRADGKHDSDVENHWRGIIRVIRPRSNG